MADYPYHLSIATEISPDYGQMHRNLTDSVCILGFADVTNSYNEDTVYKVDNINDALVEFTGDGTYDSTLVKGMIEAFHGGCRDLYVYPIGPMSGYVPPTERDSSFYTDLYTLYEAALPVVAESDDIDILVPYDADVEEAEFIELFAEHCASINTAAVRMTYFSYNGAATNTFTGEDYHTVLVNGTGLFHFYNVFSVDYSSGMASCFAGRVSSLSPDVPPDNRVVRVPIVFESDYEGDEETLEANQIVGFRKTVGYERVYDGTLVSTLSYTRAPVNSDYKALFTMHNLQRFLRGIDELDLIGSAAYIAEESLRSYFDEWVNNGYVRDIEASLYYNAYTLYISLVLHMHYPIGDIDLNLSVGPVY